MPAGRAAISEAPSRTSTVMSRASKSPSARVCAYFSGDAKVALKAWAKSAATSSGRGEVTQATARGLRSRLLMRVLGADSGLNWGEIGVSSIEDVLGDRHGHATGKRKSLSCRAGNADRRGHAAILAPRRHLGSARGERQRAPARAA